MFNNALYVETLVTKWFKPNMTASLLSNPDFELYCKSFLESISILSTTDLLAVSKSWKRKNLYHCTYSTLLERINFSTLWCNMSSLRTFRILLAGLLFETGDDLERVLKTNANFKPCDSFCFGFLPFDMDLQPFFNYFKSLPKWPRTISFAYYTNNIASNLFEEKSASLHKTIKRMNRLELVLNDIMFGIHPSGIDLICVITFSFVNCNNVKVIAPQFTKKRVVLRTKNLFEL